MTRIPEHWLPHRREDGELIGWIDLDTRAPMILPINRLGRALPPVAHWPEAEAALEEIGLRFLMEKFDYTDAAGAAHVVRIRHIYDDRIIVTTAQSDAVGDVGEEYVLPFPAPDSLRSRR